MLANVIFFVILQTKFSGRNFHANDRVYACFALYEGGVMSKENLLAELRTYDLEDQYLFHTEQALNLLTFVKAKEILL